MKVYDYYITPEEYEIAAKNGICKATLNYRIRYSGWNKETALTKRIRPKRNHEKWLPLIYKNGISRDTFYKRLKKGWTAYDAATIPIMGKEKVAKKAILKNKKYPNQILELAEKNGISYNTFITRITKSKWDVMKAATTPIITPREKGLLAKEKLNKYINNLYKLKDAEYKECCYKKLQFLCKDVSVG